MLSIKPNLQVSGLKMSFLVAHSNSSPHPSWSSRMSVRMYVRHTFDSQSESHAFGTQCQSVSHTFGTCQSVSRTIPLPSSSLTGSLPSLPCLLGYVQLLSFFSFITKRENQMLNYQAMNE